MNVLRVSRFSACRCHPQCAHKEDVLGIEEVTNPELPRHQSLQATVQDVLRRAALPISMPPALRAISSSSFLMT
jgi:hypothetical protein